MHNESAQDKDRPEASAGAGPGLPTREQLSMIFENLFERQRLVELAARCTTREESLDLRQARIEELIEILLKAWELGPKSPSGSLWGAVDQELSSRQRSYLGQGEAKLRSMLATLFSEGASDRKLAATLLWVMLRERHARLLAEFENQLSRGFRDTGSNLPGGRPICLARLRELEDTIQFGVRELRNLLADQTRQLEGLSRRLESLELQQERGSVLGSLGGGSAALRRRLQRVPLEEIRVGVFVDVQNMFYAAKKLDGARIDYESILDHIVGPRRLIKALAYIVESAEIDQSGFISVLEKKGYQVRRKELKSFMDGTAKGDWDMGMAIDVIELASYLDVVALVTGDGDFVSLVRLIKKLGPRVELYAFGHNLSSELREVSDQFFEIGTELLLKNHHRNSPAPAPPVELPPAEPQPPEREEIR